MTKSIKIKCISCDKSMRLFPEKSEKDKLFYKNLLKKLNCTTVEELKKGYKCRNHRKLINQVVSVSETETEQSKRILELKVKREGNKINLFIKTDEKIEKFV